MRCQSVCLLRLACWRRWQKGGGNCSNRESRRKEREEVAAMCLHGWMDPLFPLCSVVRHY